MAEGRDDEVQDEEVQDDDDAFLDEVEEDRFGRHFIGGAENETPHRRKKLIGAAENEKRADDQFDLIGGAENESEHAHDPVTHPRGYVVDPNHRPNLTDRVGSFRNEHMGVVDIAQMAPVYRRARTRDVVTALRASDPEDGAVDYRHFVLENEEEREAVEERLVEELEGQELRPSDLAVEDRPSSEHRNPQHKAEDKPEPAKAAKKAPVARKAAPARKEAPKVEEAKEEAAKTSDETAQTEEHATRASEHASRTEEALGYLDTEDE